MEPSTETQSVSTHSDYIVEKPHSVWQRAKAVGLKKVFVVCLGIGGGAAVALIGLGSCIAWFTSRPIPARQWPQLEIAAAGLQARLKTDWNNSVRYQLVVTPRSDDLKIAFDNTVRAHRDTIAFTIHLYDKGGFELCKKDVKPTPFVDSDDRYAGLHATETFYSLECSRSAYKDADHWNISYIFPALSPAPAQAGSRVVATAKTSVAPDTGPVEGDDVLTGFDLYSGHLETRSGKTFVVYREGEKSTAEWWNIKGQDDGQPHIHFSCKASSDCLIENTLNNQVVHGRLVR